MLPLLLLFFFSSSSSAVTSPPPLPPDALSLLAFKSTISAAPHLLHFPTKTQTYPNPHCFWSGVTCSSDGRVVRLVLSGLALRGRFAADTLTRLDQLRLLSLSNNSLYGPLPNLSGLANLRSLYLSRNAFSGRFPPSILTLHRIRTVDLSHNRLSGPILAAAAASLGRVYSLRLEFNAFDGPVPPFNQSSLKVFNVSHNNFSGPVPATAALSSMDASAFSGNPGLCGEAVRRACGGGANSSTFSTSTTSSLAPANGQLQEGLLLPSTTAASASPSGHSKRRAAIGGGLAGVFLLIGSLIGVSIAVKKRRREVDYREVPLVTEAAASTVAVAVEVAEKVKSGRLVFCGGEAGDYSTEELMRASAETIGRGTVGTTYRATMMDGRRVVAVKRLDAPSKGDGAAAVSEEEFERGLNEVGALRHPNVVPLRAYFHAKQERLLIYDYQPNGSLFLLMHGSKSTRAKPLHWTSCLKIAEDIAQGLAYIHQTSRLVHGNMKSSNVLLGPDFEACLSDCCLSFLRPEPSNDNEDNPSSSSGYRAPEGQKSNNGRTAKSDIFAFGVLLLELLTGKPPAQHPMYATENLPRWVRLVREDEGCEDERLMMLVDVAATCVRASPAGRPTAWQVVKMIQEVNEIGAGNDDAEFDGLS
ncbi:putative inactive receptor kinase [Acorus gramineus]|uniref:Inactive receptor kinase n=1 Tax=Acorus gramineus TaxID=55184 RepID=A0AAV9AZA3_ACOGR|nr:putative inactive receptor kinase [Acorus gramineus]